MEGVDGATPGDTYRESPKNARTSNRRRGILIYGPVQGGKGGGPAKNQEVGGEQDSLHQIGVTCKGASREGASAWKRPDILGGNREKFSAEGRGLGN